MKVLLVLATLAAIVAPLYAVECYSCTYINGLVDDNCLTVSGSTTLINCSTTCGKTTVTTAGTITSITRSCRDSDCTAACGSLFSIETCVGCCTTDNCNSAINVSMSIVTVFAAAIAVVRLTH